MLTRRKLKQTILKVRIKKYVQIFIAIYCLFIISCKNKSQLEIELTSLKKSEFWKILKWNSEDYSKDNLFLKVYPNKEYEWFRINLKKNRLVSLKPDSLSDVLSYEYWEIPNDSILVFKKKQDFKLVVLTKGLIVFVNNDNPTDSLIVSKSNIDLDKFGFN